MGVGIKVGIIYYQIWYYTIKKNYIHVNVYIIIIQSQSFCFLLQQSKNGTLQQGSLEGNTVKML